MVFHGFWTIFNPAGTNPVAAASARTALDLEEDDDEAIALGLHKKRTSGAQGNLNKRMKRSKDDVKQEQLAALRKEVQEICSSVAGFPQTPQGQAIGRVDRMLQKRAKELKAENDYGGTDEIQNLQNRLESVRAACRLAQNMVSGNQATRKKARSEFVAAFTKLKEEHLGIYEAFPKNVKQTFLESVIPNCVESQNWALLGTMLSENSLNEMYGPDSTAAEELTVSVAESALGTILGKHDSKDEAQSADELVAAAAKQMSEALKLVVASPLPANVQEPLGYVVSICDATLSDPEQPDKLEMALQIIMASEKKPVYRAFLSWDVGNKILKSADAVNNRLQAQKDALNQACLCQEALTSLAKGEAFQAFFQNGDEAAWSEVKALVNDMEKHCEKFMHAVSPPFTQTALQEAIAAFNTAAAQMLQAGLNHLMNFMKLVAGQLKGDTHFSLKERGWDAHANAYHEFLQGFARPEGIVTKMANMLNDHKMADKKVMDGLGDASTILILVPVLSVYCKLV